MSHVDFIESCEERVDAMSVWLITQVVDEMTKEVAYNPPYIPDHHELFKMTYY